jgi:hypothetical protein
MAAIGAALRTLHDVLRHYDLPAGAVEDLQAVIDELRKAPTPGPWALDVETGRITDAGGRVLASVPLTGSDDHANARLLAAAPDLLEACSEVVRWPATEYHGETVVKRYHQLTEYAVNKCYAAMDRARG